MTNNGMKTVTIRKMSNKDLFREGLMTLGTLVAVIVYLAMIAVVFFYRLAQTVSVGIVVYVVNFYHDWKHTFDRPAKQALLMLGSLTLLCIVGLVTFVTRMR